MGILITDRQTGKNPLPEIIKKKAQIVLNELACPDCELSVLLTDDAEIAEYNETYRERKGPTNVLSFSMRDGDFADLNPQLLGDVIISLETAQREADEAGILLQERLDWLLIHGILHLFGYDHEKSEAEYERMEKKTDALRERLRAG